MQHPNSSLSLALNQLQQIFPSVIFPQQSQGFSSLDQTLQAFTSLLPMASSKALPSTIQSMKRIADQQEFKYQKSLLDTNIIQEYETMNMFEEDCYEDISTKISHKKASNFTCESSEEVIDHDQYINDLLVGNIHNKKEMEQEFMSYLN